MKLRQNGTRGSPKMNFIIGDQIIYCNQFIVIKK
jgi:hypothetical protein